METEEEKQIEGLATWQAQQRSSAASAGAGHLIDAQSVTKPTR